MKLTFEAGYDIADLGGLELAIVETLGGGPGTNPFSVTVPSGNWFLVQDGSSAAGDFADTVTGFGSLIDEVLAQLQAGTAGGSWTVALDEAIERVTFVHDGGGGVSSVSITPTTNGGLLGLTGALSGALAHQGQRAPDYWIQSDAGFWGPDWTGEYEGGDEVAYDVEAHDGRPGGAAKDGAAIYLDFTVPTEPVAKVGNYPRVVSATAPWTWRDFWRHCRNVEPFCMRDDDEAYYLLMRAEGARFKPIARGEGYIGHWDLKFLTRVLGRGA